MIMFCAAAFPRLYRCSAVNLNIMAFG